MANTGIRRRLPVVYEFQNIVIPDQILKGLALVPPYNTIQMSMHFEVQKV